MTPPSDIQAQTQRAQALLDLGRPQEAVSVLLQALAQSPAGDARAFALLSLAHSTAGDHREALRWADRAVAAAPDGEWGHRLRAAHLLNLNAPKDALRAAEEAARLEPGTPAVLQTLVRALLRLNRARDAAVVAERLRLLTPDSYLSHETLGLVALRRQKWREAEGHCRRALAVQPDSYYGLNNLGIALSHTAGPFRSTADGRLVEAIGCLYRAAQIKPAEAYARVSLLHLVSRYLLSEALLLLLVFTLVAPAHLGTAAVPFCLLVGGLTLGVVLVVRRRRLRALPPAIQEYWRQTRRRTRTARPAWGRQRR